MQADPSLIYSGIFSFILGQSHRSEVKVDLQPPQWGIWCGRIVQMPFSIARGIYDFVMKIFQIIGDYWSGKKNGGIDEGEKEDPARLNKARTTREYIPGVDVDPISRRVITRKEHDSEVKGLRDSEKIDYYLNHEEALDTLHQFLPPSGQISNTKLGEILVSQAFSIDTYIADKASLNKLLTVLAKRAAEGNEDAYRALTYPNDLGNEITEKQIGSGFPRNTPLALLVKAGNLEGVKIILEAYKSEDLLATTYARNTVFHLAVGSGQMEIAKAILARARDLGREQEMLGARNRMDYTAKDLYQIITRPGRQFGILANESTTYFGGEEIAKATVSSRKAGGQTVQVGLATLRSECSVKTTSTTFQVVAFEAMMEVSA